MQEQSITASQLRDAANVLGASKENARHAAAAKDMASKLTQYGSFSSFRQRNYAAALVRMASGAPESEKLERMCEVKRALDAAFARKIKKPLLRVTVGDEEAVKAGLGVVYKFSRAPEQLKCGTAGRNAGSVYVKRGGSYIGKISPEGDFRAGGDCAAEDQAAIRTIAADPLKAARDSGKLTGRCACCGLELSDSKSLQQGMGQICFDKFFNAGE